MKASYRVKTSIGALVALLLVTAGTVGEARAQALRTGEGMLRPAGGDDPYSGASPAKLPVGCAAGQIPVWSGTTWVCGWMEGGGLMRLEDLHGLPCNGGAETGSVSVAINPVTHSVTLSCPRIGQYQLDVAVGGPGSVSTVPADIDCGSGLGACSHAYDSGTVVTLTAAHEADVSAFLGWVGTCSGTGATCQVPMNQARQERATFVPTRTVNISTSPTAREQSCAFGFCTYFDVFTDSRARVTVRDLDTGAVAGTCDADLTARLLVAPLDLPRTNLTTCHIPVTPGHHLRLEADDSTVLGGNQDFLAWFGGACDGAGESCAPAAPVTVHEEQNVAFN